MPQLRGSPPFSEPLGAVETHPRLPDADFLPPEAENPILWYTILQDESFRVNHRCTRNAGLAPRHPPNRSDRTGAFVQAGRS